MNKHCVEVGASPGPWEVGQTLDVRTFDAEAAKVILINRGGHTDIAYVAHMATDGDTSEQSANARLIAAAPALLALCQEVEAWLRPELVKEPERTYFWKLVAVIAKATVPQSDEEKNHG